ncbi:tetratricopeptide repeat-containing sulfotransferase family protein [Actibacterium sp. MT2.3-13A]|uniref:tetratricopeptide repeat-containing sulfotransferase family protein n=1 Tax=Actibacterium sp. MT2.3-13A TaxID=2828332 RepID=UPI001BAB1DD2|nr:tetratricopeptide repeat-containing sulfotransferase family protein [Actibacterium sp. MT2.3-13A]
MLPLNPNQVKPLFQEALSLQSKGQLDAAEQRYRTILGVAPKLVEAHFQLGRIAAARRNFDEALAHLARARDLKPSEPAIWQQMAEVLAAAADPARTRGFLQQAKSARLDPKLLLALQQRLAPRKGSSKIEIGTARPQDIQQAIDLLRKGRPAEAEARVRALLTQHPKLPILFNILGGALGAQGKAAGARAAYETALKLDPAYGEARDAYGRLLLKEGDLDGAVAAFRRVLRDLPDYAPALGNLGLALCAKGEADAGVVALRHALKSDPRQPEIRLALGANLVATRDAPEAVEILREALAQGDDRPIVHVRLAEALGRAGARDEALAEFDAALARAPDWAEAHAARAVYLQSLGEFEAAEQGFRKAIALDPGNGEHYRTFGATYRFAADDPLLAQMERYFDDPSISDASRMQFGFALARAMEQIKAHDRVFTYLRPANDLMSKRYPFDMAARARTVAGTRAAFAGTDFAARRIEGATDYAPIFVTGMPRSGTTLVEQILASHSQVTGLGEVGFAVPLISRAMLTPDGKDYLPFDALGDEVIRGFGEEIAAHLRARAPDTPRATDKSIQTYMLMGAIRLAMPRARFVLVRRDPRDLLFSIYKNYFREGTHTYAYDLATLGRYYRLFEEMVDFWREKLPGGFHEIQYEDLVANPEEETRKLLAACALDWEDQCLSFHENRRQVSTLSVHQVRQPLYASSMAAWKRYEKELAPLIEALGDLV